MKEVWKQIGLRGKMTISIGIIVLIALGLVVLGVRREVGEAIGAVLLGGAIGLVAVLVASHLLDEAFSRQRQFVSDASHELRTPLTAIRGQLEVLARRERPEAAEVRRVTGVALAEMTRIERLVEDLLTLARLDEEAPLRPVDVPLESFLRRFGEEPSLGAVTLGELPAGTLRADPDGLTQVIRNLLANARRHAGPEGRVELSAVAVGDRLTFRIDDDGPGVPPRERERVFDRFYRSEVSRDRGSGGSGLGLAIARSIIDQHGGQIWIETSSLGGARVAFEIADFQPHSTGSVR